MKKDLIIKYIDDSLLFDDERDSLSLKERAKIALRIINECTYDIWDKYGRRAAIEHYLRGLGSNFRVDMETYKQQELLKEWDIKCFGDIDKVFTKTIIDVFLEILDADKKTTSVYVGFRLDIEVPAGEDEDDVEHLINCMDYRFRLPSETDCKIKKASIYVIN